MIDKSRLQRLGRKVVALSSESALRWVVVEWRHQTQEEQVQALKYKRMQVIGRNIFVRWSLLSMGRAWKKWTRFVLILQHLRARVHTATAWSQNSVKALAMQGWKKAVQDNATAVAQEDAQGIIGKRIAFMSKNMRAYVSLTRWCQYVMDEKRLRIALGKALGRGNRLAIEEGLRIWQDIAVRGHLLRRAQGRVLFRMMQRLYWSAFSAWHAETGRLDFVGKVLFKFIARMHQCLLAAAFKMWNLYMQMRSKMRILLIKAIEMMKRAAIAHSFSKWADHALQEYRKRAVVLRVVQGLRNAALVRAVKTWMQSVKNDKSADSNAAFSAILAHSALRSSFAFFVDCVLSQRHAVLCQSVALQRFSGRYRRKKMCFVLDLWMGCVQARRYFTLENAFEMSCRKLGLLEAQQHNFSHVSESALEEQNGLACKSHSVVHQRRYRKHCASSAADLKGKRKIEEHECLGHACWICRGPRKKASP